MESCPFFRNEIGGEGDREVGLTRCPNVSGVHRPPLAYGISVLEPSPGETLWKYTCPLQKRPLPLESVDEGAHYYRRYFLGTRFLFPSFCEKIVFSFLKNICTKLMVHFRP